MVLIMSITDKDKRNAAARLWYHKNKKRLYADKAWYDRKCEINRKYMARIRKENPELLKNRDKERTIFALIKKYGLTVDQYHALQEKQDFLCAICNEERPLQIDHNHQTGKIRGLLCMPCNVSIGHLQESTKNLRSAIAYLDRWI